MIGLPDVAKARNALAGVRWGGDAEVDGDGGLSSGRGFAATANSAAEAAVPAEPASGDQPWAASPAIGAAAEHQPNSQAALIAQAAQPLPTARPAWDDHLGHIDTPMLEAILAQRYVMQLRGRGAEGYPADGLPDLAARNLPGALSQARGQGIAAGRDGANSAFAYGLPMDAEEAKRMVAPLSNALILNPANPLNPLNPVNPAHPGNLLNPGRPGVRAFVPPGPPGKPDPRTDTVVPGPPGLVPINPGASSAPPSVGQTIINGITTISPLVGNGLNIITNGLPSSEMDSSLTDPNTYIKPPANAYDPDGPKAPGKPPEGDRFKSPKGGDNWVPNPNRKKGTGYYGWEDANGDVWVPSGPGSLAHGGPHWDVQTPGGGYRNELPPKPKQEPTSTPGPSVKPKP